MNGQKGAVKEAKDGAVDPCSSSDERTIGGAESSSHATCSRKPSLVPGRVRPGQLPLPEHLPLHILLCYQVVSVYMADP